MGWKLVRTPDGQTQRVYVQDNNYNYFADKPFNLKGIGSRIKNAREGYVYKENPIEHTLTPAEFALRIANGYTPEQLKEMKEDFENSQDDEVVGYNVLPEMTVAGSKTANQIGDGSLAATARAGMWAISHSNPNYADYHTDKPYSSRNSTKRDEIANEARNLGYRTYIYNGQEYPVDYAPTLPFITLDGRLIDPLNPYELSTKDYAEAQMRQYGITSDLARNKSQAMEDFMRYTPNIGYDWRTVKDAAMGIFNKTTYDEPETGSYLQDDGTMREAPKEGEYEYGNFLATDRDHRYDMKALSAGYPTKYGTVLISNDDMSKGTPKYNYTIRPTDAVINRQARTNKLGEKKYDDEKTLRIDPSTLKKGEMSIGQNASLGNVTYSGLGNGDYSVYDAGFDYSPFGALLDVPDRTILHGHKPETYYRVYKKDRY